MGTILMAVLLMLSFQMLQSIGDLKWSPDAPKIKYEKRLKTDFP